jgi:hypothetical protein
MSKLSGITGVLNMGDSAEGLMGSKKRNITILSKFKSMHLFNMSVLLQPHYASYQLVFLQAQ